MELYEAMERRRSVRAYKPDPVPQESVDRILRAAQVAPSWKNRQAWSVIVVRDRAKVAEIGALLQNNPRGVDYRTLAAVVALCMDPTRVDIHDGKEYYLVDAGIVGEHIVLAAQAEGLGTCWIGWFDGAPIEKALGVPKPHRIVMLTPLGYPDEEPIARPRKAIGEIAHWDRW